MPAPRSIIHIDMDAFFASIEQRDNPQLKGKPVIIGADPRGGRGRGVVSTCSYEARRYGIHSAMPISAAYRRCPRAAFLPVDMKKYERISGLIYDILYDFTPQIEPVGIDEAFLDITGSWRLFGSPLSTSVLIKSKIKKEAALTASIGLAPTKMAAKIASDLRKPDGLVEVTPHKLLEFLWPLEVERIWGLGKKSKIALNNTGIRTIGDLAKTDPARMADLFGKNGICFWKLANGVDESVVVTGGERKSISNEHTFQEDTLDGTMVGGTLMQLSEKVSHRLRLEGFKGKTITLKIRLESFQTFTRSCTMPGSTSLAGAIYGKVKNLYEGFEPKRKKVRLLGVKVSNLSKECFRDSLFDKQTETDRKKEGLQSAIDSIKQEFGSDSIHFATGSIFDTEE